MSNRKELKRARDKYDEAGWMLDAIERLPRRVGQQVRWSNGVIWERAGDDIWRPWHYDKDDDKYTSDDSVYGFYPSGHVASAAGNWNPIERVSVPLRESVGTDE